MAKPIRRGKKPARGKRQVGVKANTQNTGRSVARAFGGATRVGRQMSLPPLEAMDAFHPCHMALPRAVGDYVTTRSTQIVTTNATTTLFGTLSAQSVGDAAAATKKWSSIIGIRVGALGGASNINAAMNAHRICMDAVDSSTYDRVTMVPSAFSIQLMNPNALNTTSGIVYACRMKTQVDIRDLGRTWDAYAGEVVSFNNPRLMSAGKLALSGVAIDATPFDMSDLADFRPVKREASSDFTYGNANDLSFEGFSPIFIHNPDAINLQFLVCVEYRTRFDPSNPAQAAHRHHPPSSDRDWASVVARHSAQGHGVFDIADKVAKAGMSLAGRAMPYFRMAKAIGGFASGGPVGAGLAMLGG